MNDTMLPAVIGGTIGGVCGLAVCSIVIMRTTCPNLFARYFGWRTETVSFVPPESLTIKTPREQSLRVYRSNSGSRRITA